MTDRTVDVPAQPKAGPGEQRVTLDLTAPVPTVAVPVPVPAARVPAHGVPAEQLVCPSCGTPSEVDAARRDARDFCRSCDYPLFWAVDRPAPTPADVADSGLRRLPGTAGRAALAALLCWSCTERNDPVAQLCSRCGADLHPVAAPEPEPVAETVVLVAEPEERLEVWPYALACAVLAALVMVLAVAAAV